MSTDSDTPTVHVPPPPLTAEEERSPARLHWVTAVLVMLISGAVQWGSAHLIDLVWQRSGSGARVYTGLLNLMEAGSAGLVVGLGAVIADRVAPPRRSRAVRWAIGMGLAGLVAGGMGLAIHAWPVSQAAQARLLLPLLYNTGASGLGYGLLGLLLGLGARSEGRAKWRLPLLGLVGFVAPSAIMLSIGLMSAAAPPRPGQWETLLLSLAAAALRGAAIGAAFAVGLALGGRRAHTE